MNPPHNTGAGTVDRFNPMLVVIPSVAAEPNTSSLCVGVVLPIAIFPSLNTLTLSMLFVLITNGCASVVPMKSVTGSVQVLPVSDRQDDHIGVHAHKEFLYSIVHQLSRKPYHDDHDTVLKFRYLLEPYIRRLNHKLPIGFI